MFYLHALALLLVSIFTSNTTAAIPEKPMVIVITSWNNEKWYKWNLDSVFGQNYTNYRVLYLDDASADNTGNLVQQYIAEKKQQHRVTLIKKPSWVSQMANHYHAVRLCDDNEIVVHLDGDDALIDPHVLSYINNIYSTTDTWITYGSPLIWPANDWRPQFIIDLAKKLPEMAANNSFRTSQNWHFGHLRTFYAWLFKHIQLKDLIIESSFVPTAPAPDVNLMLPMVEMAATHVKFTEPALYLWNRNNPLSQPSGPQYKLVDLVCSWPKYQPLSNPDRQISQKYNAAKADILLIASNPQLTANSIASIVKHVKEYDKIAVLCNKANVNEFTQIAKKWSTVRLIQYDSNAFDAGLTNAISQLHDHIVLATDSYTVTEAIDMNNCIRELEAAKACGFYFYLTGFEKLLAQGQKTYAPLTDTIFAWQPHYGLPYIVKPNQPSFTLYRKKYIAKRLAAMKNIDKTRFESLWTEQQIRPRKVGLFFKQSKIK